MTTLPLRLNAADALPSEFVRRLAVHRRMFETHQYVDTILENPSVRAIADDLEAYLKRQRVKARLI